jgi:hypothetical protein
VVTEEKIFRNQTIRNKNCLWRPCSLTDRGEISILYGGPSIDASYQVLIHLTKRLQRRRFLEIRKAVTEEKIFKNQTIRNKNCLWRPCSLTDRGEMSNLHRGPSIDASYQVSIHLAKRFQRRIFLEISQSETRIAYGGHVCYQIGTK